MLLFSAMFLTALVASYAVDFFGLPFGGHVGRVGTYYRQAEKVLQQAADVTEQRIRGWIDERQRDIHLFVENRTFAQRVQELARLRSSSEARNMSPSHTVDALRSSDAYRNVLAWLREIQHTFEQYQELLVLDAASGVVLVATDESRVGSRPPDDEFLKNVHRRSASVVSDVAFSERGDPMLSIGHSIPDHQLDAPAVMILRVTMADVLPSMLRSAKSFDEQDEAFLLDRRGRTISGFHFASDRKATSGASTQRPDSRAGRLALSGRRGVIETTDYRGRPVVAVYRPVDIADGPRWGLVVKRDRSAIWAPIRRELATSIGVLVAGALALVALTLAIARGVTGPLRRLSECAEQVSAGNLGVRAAPVGSTEVRQLATTFNQMISRVAHWQRDMEQEVAARTAQLEKANEALRREAEARRAAQHDLLRAHTELDHVFNAAVPLAVFGLDRRILRVNDTFARLLGVEPEILLATQCDQACRIEWCHGPSCPLTRIADGEGRVEFETRLTRRDGTSLDCVITCLPYRDADGRLIGVVESILDITRRKQDEAELQRYRHHLEELVDERTRELHAAQEALLRQERLAALGQLIGGVSHELRTPLGTLRTSVYLLTRHLREQHPELRDVLLRTERSILRCDAIISDLLDYARGQKLDRRPTSLDAWIESVLDEYQPPSNVRLCHDLQAPVTIAVDRERFRRCVLNLLNNAVQALPEQGGRVDVRSRVDHNRVQVSVIDNGCGIAEDQREKILEPLFSTKSFGVGLGLPIVAQIAEQHGGTLLIESRVGEGTTVSITLPLQDGVDHTFQTARQERALKPS